MEIAALVIAVVGLVVGVIALAMALPTALQMFCGAPRILFNFSEINAGDGRKMLYCDLSNAPVENRVLRRLGVRRDPTVITARFRICEAGSNSIMMDTAQARLIDTIGDNDKGSIRATITDHFGGSFLCGVHRSDDD